jgi:hypothetical protein
MNEAFKFSGLANDSTSMMSTTTTTVSHVPRTLNHGDIFQNSSRVVKASSGSGPGKQQHIQTKAT